MSRAQAHYRQAGFSPRS